MSQKKLNLVRLTPDEVLLTKYLPADLYLKLADDNYILIGKEGTKDQFEEFQVSEKLKLGAQFYVEREDYRKFTQAHVQMSNEIINNENVAVEEKTKMLSKTLNSVFQSIEFLGFTHESYGQAKFVSNAVLKVVENQPKLSHLFESLNQVSDEIIRHSLAVSAVSVMIAQQKGIHAASVLEKISLGALLHDIGLKEYPIEFLKKSRLDYNSEDYQYYEKHPFQGVEILKNVPHVPQEVIAIVFEHHENSMGLGFPRGLRDLRLHPLSKIVALAVSFCDLTFESINNPTPREAMEALEFIDKSMGQPFNKEVFQALKSVLTSGLKRATFKIVS